MERTFPTFCHISDYAEQGYKSLSQMIAASSPLVLWCPSSVELDDYFHKGVSPISAKELLSYIEQGRVQIIGRERWLLDKQHRQNHSWPGARWQDHFDEELKRMYEQYSGPEEKSPVRIVEEEDGYDWAEDLLLREPSRSAQIWRLIEDERVPKGTLEKAQRYGDNRYKAVREVLRDVRNHMRAFELAKARIPFFLQNDDEFFSLLEANDLVITGPVQVPGEKAILAEFARATDRVIERLTEEVKYIKRQTVISLDLGRFMGSEAQTELINWLRSVADAAESESPINLDKFLLERLRGRIDDGLFKRRPVDSLLLSPKGFEKKPAISEIIMGIASIAFDPSNALNLGLLRMNVVPIISRISQRLGIVKPDYKGPQWPFLYTLGREAETMSDIKVIIKALDTLISEESENEG